MESPPSVNDADPALRDPVDALAWLSDARHLLGDQFRFQGGDSAIRPEGVSSSQEYLGQARRLRGVLNRLALAGVRSRVGPRTVQDGFELADEVDLELGPEVGTDFTDILIGILDLRMAGTDRVYRRGPSTFELHYSSIRESDPAHAEWCEPE